MKKGIVLFLVSSFVFLSYCTSTRKPIAVQPSQPPVQEERLPAIPVTYSKHIEPLLVKYCEPCHFPESNGEDGPLDTYDTVKAQINDIIYRIELNPNERGFMPVKDKKLPDSTIQLFYRWKKEGFLQ